MTKFVQAETSPRNQHGSIETRVEVFRLKVLEQRTDQTGNGGRVVLLESVERWALARCKNLYVRNCVPNSV
ncbi:hypothetical protein R1flu_006274 [Riccia fluitans]|uniref:Uncharacterized protein n=1 Tax=Riccia fluitans TaxID=41844 RepID=A0ABD1YWE0_9MARC